MKSNLIADNLNKDNIFDDNLYSYIRPETEIRVFHDGLVTKIHAISKKNNVINDAKLIIKNIYLSIKLTIDQLNAIRKSPKSIEKSIISSGYFSIEKEFEKLGYKAFRAPWVYNIKSELTLFPSYKLFKAIEQYERIVKNTPFYELLSPSIKEALLKLKIIFIETYKEADLSAFVCASNYPTCDKLSIDVMNEIGKVSFQFQHGLPGAYDAHMKYYNGSFDLIVWGQAFKEKWVSLGLTPDSIHVAGHPWYKNLVFNKLKFELKDILVITKATWGIRVDSQDKMGDNSAALLYLYSIQSVLKKLGVERVRLRPHFNENPNWYRKFLDPNFFVIDNDNLVKSIAKSTLVIGPTSTVFIDTTYYGVSYLVYEPTFEGKADLFGNPIVFPFDGSDERVVVAYNEEELLEFLKEKKLHDLTFWPDYVQSPLNLNTVIRKIEDRK